MSYYYLADCPTCYPYSIASCPDGDILKFITGQNLLTPLTDYTIKITNHFGQVYAQDVTTNAFGNISLDISLFPEGMFNPFAGFFTLEAYIGAEVQNMLIDSVLYPCIQFDVYSETATN